MRSRYGVAALVVVAVLGLVGCTTEAPSSQRAAPGVESERVSAGEPNTISVDLGRNLGAFPFRPGGQLSATPKSWRYGPSTMASLARLKLTHVRVWLTFEDAYDTATRTPKYSRWYDYLDTYHELSDVLIVVWQSNYDPLVTKGSFSADDMLAAQRDMLAHYKQRYPKIQYVEAENEPADIEAYYPKYRMMYRVVNAVSAMKLPGPELKIGGPTLDTFSERRIGQFLDRYKADSDPGKRLDFVSYHQYLISTDGEWHDDKDNPAIVATERRRLDQMLTRRGLVSRPVLVTESGTFPALRESSPALGLDADLHIQAAGMAAMHYYYLNQRDVIPLHWTIDHPENDRKDMFLDTDSGEPRPYYNAMRMQSMLPETRYAATSDRLDRHGIGVYALAAANPQKIAVMTWNYQWTRKATYVSQVKIANVPPAFRDSNVLVERYKIGKDMHSGALRKVESFVASPRADGSFQAPGVSLGPNELHLLVMTPTKDPVGPRP